MTKTTFSPYTLIFLLCISCHNHTAVNENAPSAHPDSAVQEEEGSYISEIPASGYWGMFEDSTVKLVLYSNRSLPDSLRELGPYDSTTDFLVVQDKMNGFIDSLPINRECADNNDAEISDITESVQLGMRVFRISTRGCSDWYDNEYVGLTHKRLKFLFALSDAKPTELSRKNILELYGTVAGRDELVANFQDYPIVISTRNFQVTQILPDTQEISYETEALESFTAHKYDDSTAVIIQAGKHLIIDTLFRKTQMVNFSIDDSIRLTIPFSDIKGKILSNTAG